MSEHTGDWKRATDTIKGRANFVQIARDVFGLSLKKAGSEYVCSCPFHDEKSPSFYINPGKGLYLCRARCTPGGDIIRFVAKMQGTTDGEAIAWLGAHLGVELPNLTRAAPASRSDPKAPVNHLDVSDEVALLSSAATFYRQQAAGSSVFSEFIRQRTISPDSHTTFWLGYANNDSSALLEHLSAAVGSSKDDPKFLASMDRIGLWRQSKGSLFFQNRIMFPVSDRTGKVVGFAGRKVNDADHGPKYINSPETPYFKKSNLLYGLQPFAGLDPSLTKSWVERIRTGNAVVVEGYTDVIALSSIGIWAVASMGTSFTESHLVQLRQRTYDGQITFCFDGDVAGSSAALRTAQMLLYHYKDGDQFFVQSLPNGQDPDELVSEGVTAETWRQFPAIPLMTFWSGSMLDGVDLHTIEGRVRAVRSLNDTLATLGDQATITKELFNADFRQLITNPVNREMGISDIHPWVRDAIKACCENLAALKEYSFHTVFDEVAAVHPVFCPYPGLHELITVAHVISKLDAPEDWYTTCGELLKHGVPANELIFWGRIASDRSPAKVDLAEVVQELPAITEFCSAHSRLIVMQGGIETLD